MENKSRRDFGSFHASNVQELLVLSEKEYVPPSMPFELPSFDHLGKPAERNNEKDDHQTLPFGKPFKDQHFLLEEGCTFLNHGAFGAALKEGLKVAQQWQDYIERQPLRFFDRELLPHLVYVTRRLAKFVQCDPEDLVLLTNATTAINSVLRSLSFAPGSVILCLNLTYGAVKKLLQQVCQDTGATLREVAITLPVTSPSQIVEAVQEAVSQGDVKLAVLDHIPSNVPIILPLQQIIPICHHHDVPVLVDGAHALGQLPLDLGLLNADFYVSNCHKWFCSPKGAAFLHVRKDRKPSIRPLVISHGYGSGFNSEFIWAGLHDYSPFLALHTVLDFWNAVNVMRFRLRAYAMAKYAGDHLTLKWGTERGAAETMFACMTLVELPSGMYSKQGEVDYSLAETVQNTLYHHYNIEVPVKAVQGKLYVRVSAHLYTTAEDIHSLEQAITDMAREQETNKLTN